MKVSRALISVSDKRGVEGLARFLAANGVEIISTGGTFRQLSEAGVPVVPIGDHTGFPEMLDGRLKTLHPVIHGGILGIRDNPAHQRDMAAHGIGPIDLVVVNLYPFEQTVARGCTLAEAVEQIDIGGPTMIRAAAKNHRFVGVVVDPDDYPAVQRELEQGGMELSAATRLGLAVKVFNHTARYDGIISNHLTRTVEQAALPSVLCVQASRVQTLRYGENPHQAAAFYRTADNGLPACEQLQGKELSYNNIMDIDAAAELASGFPGPAVAIIKHANPCGVGLSDGPVAEAYRRALACDPVSAFGGIVGVNRPVDAELAGLLAELFLEVVVAPAFSDQALELLSKKKNLRLIRLTDAYFAGGPELQFRKVRGGLLVQDQDTGTVDLAALAPASRRAPAPDEREALGLAWRVARFVKSNAIVFANRWQTVGIGAGQMSRVDSVRLAAGKAKLPLAGCVMASDGFFPFRDGVDEAARAGITAVVQPGGSVRDGDAVQAADEHGMAMLVTGMRHFRH